jgi:riboflavin transporter FmnP
MKSIICLLVTLGIAYGAILPAKPNNCAMAFCTMVFLVCEDGTPAPVPAGSCCPSLSACPSKPIVDPIIRPNKCAFTFCTMDLKVCPNGKPAPIPAGECCPSYSACPKDISRRSNPLASLLSGNNLLQSLSTATHGTNLGTAISILNLLNNIQQLSTDVHQIPLLINQTIANILNGTGQASQLLVDQLIGAASNIIRPPTGRDLLGSLGQSASLLSSIGHLLPQGTSISTVLSILNLLNNVNALNNDIHQIPVLLNQTLAGLVGGAGQASQMLVQQLLGLVGGQAHIEGRDLLGSLGQSAGLLSSISHLLPQGTSISTVLSILNLLNNVNALSNDIHQIPALLNQTLAGLVGGAGQASQMLVQQLLGLVGGQAHIGGRDLLGSLGQNANLLSSISHLLPQGTSITTIISLLNLLNNVNALNTDLHTIPAVLQETLQSLLGGIQNLIPPTLQPVY